MIIDTVKANQSKVMPMLVELYNAQQIQDLAQNNDQGSRSELLDIITELLGMELSPREGELIADVLICLMRQVERDVCVALSEKLADMENAPLRLVMHIANEAIDIARPVLSRSPVFSDMDLIYIIRAQSADYWRALATRTQMGAEAIVELAKQDDAQTAQYLADNGDITLPHEALSLLTERARVNEKLAKQLLVRSELTPDIVRTLYHGVGVALKHYIRQNFESFSDQADHALDEVVLDFEDVSETAEQEVAAPLSDVSAATKAVCDGVHVARMVKCLEKGQYKEFLVDFAQRTQISAENINYIISQESGQGLAVVCKAMRIERRDFVSLYLLMNRIRMKGGMVDPKNLRRATRYYDQIGRDVAEDILERIRTGQKTFS